MDQETVRRLNRITRRFYDASARGFAAGREMPWPGWLRVLELLAPTFAEPTTVSVLDLGCGDGRFGSCLANHLGRPFTYLGVDSSPRLIERARTRLATIAGARCQVRDLIEAGATPRLPAGKYNLVAGFGLLHHIPSYRRRRELVEALCRRTAPGGAVALSTWRLRSPELMRRKQVPWRDSRRLTGESIDRSQVEPGDHLIAKPGDRPRYCHLIESAEEERLFADLPLELVATFNADGRCGHLNRYFVLRRHRPASRPTTSVTLEP